MADTSEVLKVTCPGPRATRSDDEEEPFVSFDGVVEPEDAATGVEAIGVDDATGFVAITGNPVSSPAGGTPIVLSIADS